MKTHLKLKAVFALTAYLATVVLANYLTGRFGLVTVFPGLVATAGTFAAGLAFTLRDILQDESGGKRFVIAAVVVAALVSALIAPPAIAIASGLTFVIAEIVDFAIYTPLRQKHWWIAVLASAAIGLTVDTFLFLALAGFPITTASVTGQILCKSYMTVLFAIGLAFTYKRRDLSLGI